MTLVIRQSKPQGCDLCGEVAELRPYGPNGEWVCFTCGMRDQRAAIIAFKKRLDESVEPKDQRTENK